MARTVSLITCDLGVILELAGGFSATALAYIFRTLALILWTLQRPTLLSGPAAAACYLKLTTPIPGSHPNRKTRTQRLAAWVCCGFGVVVMVLSTTLSILKAHAGTSHKVC